jgi:hypothetical protein
MSLNNRRVNINLENISTEMKKLHKHLLNFENGKKNFEEVNELTVICEFYDFIH